MKKFLMGNEAIAMGAIHAGVNLVCGYPGTPSSEILETVAKNNADGNIYVEWSVNEKAAMEVAAGASYAGARTLVTMKQVGLNVASDPLMSLAYVGVKGGMVIVSADDPGPISSQTEQDTRHFARFAKLPVFDPSSPEETYAMIEDAFALSEEYHTPVLFRPTTRVCHGCVSMEIADTNLVHKPDGFVKDPKWIIFPRLSYQSHLKIEERNPLLGEKLSSYRFNLLTGSGTKGIATGGISYEYTKEALGDCDAKLLKVSTPHPFPEKLALEFLNGLSEVMVIEELDPVIERELIYICGKYHLNVTVKGKLSGDVQKAGENTVESVKMVLHNYLGLPAPEAEEALPPMPVRPPVLCAGCPHRASFYAVKQAMKGQKAVFAGDIGCYTLGNAMPLDMVDTCLCMGADITIAQGLHHIEPDAKHFAFIGDSTFFASGITGMVNAVYNESDITLIVLDNSTTAMTGHQPHPGTGKTMMGHITEKVSIPAVLIAIGIKEVSIVNPLNLKEAIAAVKKAADYQGVSAVIFKSPCIAVTKPLPAYKVDSSACIGCKKCIKELGCPAIAMDGKKAFIEPSLCYGCSICAQVCPCDAIKGEC
ncbi:MAG TPA: indolepyruvate ferredoxin oxidoreductase subunit alpha [Oscillospiraceae bacterium]|nr:indolepyruvate ferredoxin oxidoreductase subunit alpha [Oscillospiraceae bacterium]